MNDCDDGGGGGDGDDGDVGDCYGFDEFVPNSSLSPIFDIMNLVEEMKQSLPSHYCKLIKIKSN